MHFFTWVLALCIPIGLQLNFKFLEKVIDLLIILTNCLNRLQNRNYILTMDIIEDVVLEETDASLKESDEFYRRLNKMNEKVKETYNLNETNNNPEENQDLEQFNQEQYYKEMEEMQEQVNKLSQLQELTQLPELQDKELQSHDSTPEEYKDIEHIVAKVNLVNNKIYIDESLE
jgi:hypothetical protein